MSEIVIKQEIPTNLPKPLQDSINENARFAQQRAEMAAALKKKAAEDMARAKKAPAKKAVALKKDGTPMKKRGPKPKKEGEVVVKKETLPKSKKTLTSWQKSGETPCREERLLENTFLDFVEDVSDLFLDHLYSMLARTRRARKST
jgi:hypothetical protein